ncbi:MAG: PAS domain S-box protein [Paraglaciecola sp.]|nr:PAS domain S-box protein [Paraglaciecola sp.]
MIEPTQIPKLLPWILVRILPVAAIVFIAMGFMATKHSRATFQSHYVETLDRELQLNISKLTDKLNGFRSSVQAIAKNSLIVNSLVDIETRRTYLPIFFNKLQIAGSRHGDIIFTDYKGRLLAANKPRLQVKDLSKYELVFQGGEYLHIDATGLDFAVPVIYNGNTEGIIIVRYDHDQLASLLSNGASLHAALIHKGQDILHSSGAELTQLFRSKTNNSNWIERRAQVPQYPSIGIVIAAPEETVLAGLYEIEGFIYFIIFASLTILSIGIFLAIFMTSRQLRQFMDQVRRVGHASDLDRKISPSGFAEIHALTTAFNSMLQRLQNAVVSQADLTAEVANRKQAEVRLREREERTNAIVENILEGVITIDGDSNIEMCNPAASQIFGYTQDQIVGKNFRILMPSTSSVSDSGYIRNYVATGKKKALGLCRQVIGLRSNGERFFMELTMSPMRVGDRNMFTCVVRDITEQKRVEDLKNEFVSIVSHELRTPLTALVGSLALVSTGVVGAIPDKAKNLISIAHNNATRLTQLVNDILDVEKIESGKMEYNFEDLENFDW